MAEDWMKWLTEEEAAALEYTQTVGASAGAAHTVEVLHVCNQAVLNLRTVAALRALVGEKDGALVCSYAMRGLDPCYRSRGTPCVPCHVRALTEDDMRKRMEE